MGQTLAVFAISAINKKNLPIGNKPHYAAAVFQIRKEKSLWNDLEKVAANDTCGFPIYTTSWLIVTMAINDTLFVIFDMKQQLTLTLNWTFFVIWGSFFYFLLTFTVIVASLILHNSTKRNKRPWNDLEKVTESSTIWNPGYGVLFAFCSNYGRIFSHLWNIQRH